jgi:hypothetical protein
MFHQFASLQWNLSAHAATHEGVLGTLIKLLRNASRRVRPTTQRVNRHSYQEFIMFLHRTAPRSESTARTGLTRQVSIYSHKVWWRRAQDAKEITHAIQQQVKTLKDECVAVVEKDHDEIEAQSKASACSQSHDDLSVKIKNLDLLLRHVPLTSADQSFVMARLKSTCIDLRQLEMRAAILGMLCITLARLWWRGSGWATRRFLQPIAWAIGKKNNAVDRPSPCCHSPQGVMQSIPSYYFI